MVRAAIKNANMDEKIVQWEEAIDKDPVLRNDPVLLQAVIEFKRHKQINDKLWTDDRKSCHCDVHQKPNILFENGTVYRRQDRAFGSQYRCQEDLVRSAVTLTLRSILFR